MMVFIIIIGLLIIVIFLIQNFQKSSIQKPRKTAEELKNLPSGIHFFKFYPSHPKDENIKNLGKYMLNLNKIGVETKGNDWDYIDNSSLDFWQPEKGKPFYLYSLDINDEPEYKLIGFVNYEFYDWFDYVNDNRERIKFLDIEFDPFEKIVYFSVLK